MFLTKLNSLVPGGAGGLEQVGLDQRGVDLVDGGRCLPITRSIGSRFFG